MISEATMNAESEPTANHQPGAPLASDTTLPLRPARITVDAQGLALVILATIAVVFALEWAQSFLIPLGVCRT